MGKREKKQKHQRGARGASYYLHDDDDDSSSSFSQPEPVADSGEEPAAEEEEDTAAAEDDNDAAAEDEETSNNIPSKFLLYQQSVQSPKGDISYLQKFFLMYIGGRVPLHFQEDFCGTALLSTEWLRSDSRRTAIGVDLDVEALKWCMENNINKIGADCSSRISLFHGDVLQPSEAKLLRIEPQELIDKVTLEEQKANPEKHFKRNIPLPSRDIVCAFNFSCCCLHKRADLVLYFEHVLDTLSKKGGIFVMDLYGGTSSEGKLRLQRRFPNFTYIWEQAEFDIIERKTRISLHFHLQKQQKKLRHAFSYSWRLWSLPEIRDCLEEAGFQSIHFWLRQTPDSEDNKSTEGFGVGRDIKYEEVKTFEQQDSWNAYVVAVANKK
ncbi:S-adenosyl-L-methionine-dependent methyltransferases superfamily protein [Euphorbia peplus]|nr:S-adenosyl-L-methionine-dependent methyltransferases superfamily protein [Euphorbia peplus]